MAKKNTTKNKDEDVQVEDTVQDEVLVDDADETPADGGEDKVDSVNAEDASEEGAHGGAPLQDEVLEEDDPPTEPESPAIGQPRGVVPTDEVAIAKSRGVYMVALGEKARDAAIRSTGTLHGTNPQLPITVVSDRPLNVPGVSFQFSETDNPTLAKLNADKAPYGYVVYLDADTYTHADLEAGFKVLEDGWDMVVVPSNKKGEPLLAGVSVAEVEATCGLLGNYEPLRLQGTLIFFRKSSAVKDFFKAWREEWGRYKGLDRAAMLRALKRVPIRVWFFGESYHNGSVIAHHRGTAR